MAETKRVIYYDQLSGNQPTSGDVIFVDNPNTGTHKMDLKSFVDAINNGFDSSIKSSGVSVSADNYSSIITNADDQPVNSIYTYGAGLQSKVSNLPSNKAMTIINFAQKSTGGLGQVMLAVERNGSDDYLYFRTIGGSPAVWSSWVKVANNSDVEAVREALDNLDIETDKTLSISGKPADAKAAGDAINDVKADLNDNVSELKNTISAVADVPINLYNDETYVEGYYIDTATGNVTQYNNWGYFTASVKGGEEYYLMGVPTSDPTQYITVGDLYVGYYNGDNFVSGQRIASKAENKALNVPVNANIAKVSTHNYSLGHGNSSSLKNEKIMFVSANVYPRITVPGDYIPYMAEGIKIKETALPDSVLFNSDLDSYDLVPAIEPYFKDEVTETVNTTLAKSNKPCTIISVVTDSHVSFSNQTRLRQAEDTFNNLRTVNQKVWCDCIAHLGDLLVADDTTITQEMADQYMNYIRTRLSSAKDKLFITQGNHDGLGGSAPQTQNYNSLGKFNSAYVVRDGDNPYFYVDFDNPKVRLVFLAFPQRVKIRTKEYSYWGLYTPQLRWLGQVALNVDDGRNVIICSHIGTQSSDFRKNRSQTVGILNAFNAHSTFDVYYEDTTNFIYTADFTNLTNSKVVLWICGHEHFDWVVPESVSGLTFPLVTLTCSYCYNGTVPSSAASQGAVAPTRTAGTVTQEAWTIIIYNAEDAKISFVRFGAGTDFEINLSDYTSFS